MKWAKKEAAWLVLPFCRAPFDIFLRFMYREDVEPDRGARVHVVPRSIAFHVVSDELPKSRVPEVNLGQRHAARPDFVEDGAARA
jgi:hypothetical protein